MESICTIEGLIDFVELRVDFVELKVGFRCKKKLVIPKKAVFLHHENLPSLSTMLKCAVVFYSALHKDILVAKQINRRLNVIVITSSG